MKPFNTIALIITSVALLACSPDNSSKTRLFKEERNALDNAKAVDNAVQQQTQQLQQNVEQQSQ
jgi:hypothetical protein